MTEAAMPTEAEPRVLLFGGITEQGLKGDLWELWPDEEQPVRWTRLEPTPPPGLGEG
eukprot:CAMPEP_0118967400 /NCGR_PEP_ID=MMETSP1173-20130426/4794_1 /TAXON_ID=1034831 /ORGANISM="Rhizochromulina marina cf, Strain CCMP1243" /LENGTH=56 /DNA_ID=CAMNT_0006916363 /DNA_START=66 /DNA_END=233 /DNA_ORIENTATION=+